MPQQIFIFNAIGLFLIFLALSVDAKAAEYDEAGIRVAR